MCRQIGIVEGSANLLGETRLSPFGVPLEFILFAATLLAVALFHRRTLTVALVGLVSILIYKLFVAGFDGAPGFAGFSHHLEHHWVELANLGLLLLGFAILSRQFEQSGLPERARHPSRQLDWRSGASGAGVCSLRLSRQHRRGAGSVVGDTTTTMMWIAGKSPLELLPAYVGAIAAFAVFALPAAHVQHRFAPIQKHAGVRVVVDWVRVAIVAVMLVSVVGSNVAANLLAPELLHAIPLIGLALWLAILATALFRAPDWKVMPEAIRGAAFLLALVLAASLMPVKSLPAPTWMTTLGLGAISSVFDNIPLTALALQQGGYDWALLAYAVGFGGSMLWFGARLASPWRTCSRRRSLLLTGYAQHGG